MIAMPTVIEETIGRASEAAELQYRWVKFNWCMAVSPLLKADYFKFTRKPAFVG